MADAGSVAADDERWQRALALALAEPTPTAPSARQRRRTTALLAVVGALIALLVVTAVAVWALPLRVTTAQGEQVRLADQVLFVVLGLIGTAGTVHERGWRSLRQRPTGLDTAQRTLVHRELVGRVALRAEHLPLVLQRARGLAGTRWAAPLFLAMAGVATSGVLTDTRPGDTAFDAALLLVACAGYAFMVVTVRRGQRFLAQHAEPRVG